MQKRGKAELVVVLLFAALAVGGMVWFTNSPATPTGNWYRPSFLYTPGVNWPWYSRAVVVYPVALTRVAYQCECITPRDAGYCIAGNCVLDGDARDTCLKSLSPGSTCGKCDLFSNFQDATKNLHIVGSGACK